MAVAKAAPTTPIPMLLNMNANPNLTNDFGTSALMLAVCAENAACVESFRKAGVNFDLVDRAGMTALHLAIKMSNLHLVTLLLLYGAHISAKGAPYSALQWAVKHAPVDFACELLENRPTDDEVWEGVRMAVTSNKPDCFKLLMQEWDRRGKSSRRLKQDNTLLHEAVLVKNLNNHILDELVARVALQNRPV